MKNSLPSTKKLGHPHLQAMQPVVLVVSAANRKIVISGEADIRILYLGGTGGLQPKLPEGTTALVVFAPGLLPGEYRPLVFDAQAKHPRPQIKVVDEENELRETVQRLSEAPERIELMVAPPTQRQPQTTPQHNAEVNRYAVHTLSCSPRPSETIKKYLRRRMVFDVAESLPAQVNQYEEQFGKEVSQRYPTVSKRSLRNMILQVLKDPTTPRG